MSVATALATVLAEPAAAYSLTAGRTWSLVAAVLGVAGLVAGGRALARSGRGGSRRAAVLAVTAGLAGAAVGAAVVAAADGGPGSGSGIVGGVAALAVGLCAASLGGLALARARARV
jgi:uncharacterized protein DUF6223